MIIRSLLRKMIKREKSSESSYIQYLKKLGCRIGSDFHIYSLRNIYIDTQFPWMIEIGDHVHITNLICHDYSWVVGKHLYGEVLGGVGSIKIGNNVFIGTGSIILKNSRIGNNVIIGAGSVVTGTIPDNCVAVGAPAKKLMSIDEYWERRKKSQYEEAASVVREYRKVFKKDPPKSALPAYFFLFEPRDTELESIYSHRLTLSENYEQSLDAFLHSKPEFSSYQEFLNSID